MNEAQRPPGRILAIDSMRGIASLMVVVYHLDAAMGSAFDAIPAWVGSLFHQGLWGVHVFFILSGYVIALSTERLIPGVSGFFRFALRRGTRLDPPYIVSIIVAISLTAISNHLFVDTAKELPSLTSVASHLVYLQEILGFPHIVAIYWSLCYEVQMYSFYVLLVFASTALGSSHRLGERWNRIGQYAVFWVPTFAFSWAVHFVAPQLDLRGLATPYWFLFALGAIIRSMHRRKVAPWAAALCAATAILGGVVRAPGEGLFILLTVGVLWNLQHSKVARVLGESASLSFLGRISYSLYLFHPILGWRSISVMRRYLPDDPPLWAAIAVFLAGIAFSLVTAWMAYLTLEKPAIGLSRRISLPKTAR